MKKIIITLMLILIVSGCSLFKRDSMENINIITTIYPIEYVLNLLYKENSVINSIYPDGTNTDKYGLTEKQVNDFSEKDMFVYMGTTNDKEIAVKFLNKNKDIKIIDATYGMEYTYGIEELWLSPANLLMIAQNIKEGLKEYITNNYLTKEVDEAYDELKIKISEFDANIKLSIKNATNKTIFVSSESLRYLEKYGLTIISLDKNSNSYDKNLAILKDYIKDQKVNYIYVLENGTVTDQVNQLISESKISSLPFRNLKNITDEERDSEKDYIKIMTENLENLEKELY